MCGIAGFVIDDNGRLDAHTIERIAGVVRHRGPDDSGFYTWSEAEGGRILQEAVAIGPREVGLLHRRLAILDMSARARQPMSSPDGRYTVVFNGVIYNFIELREELAARGHRFESTGDCAVLLAALAEWGVEALKRFTGMFAFALIDTASRKLLLARDFAGMKPLYYTRWRGGFAFASEIKALLELPGVNREVDPQQLYDYLRAGLIDHEEGTMFSAVKQVPAGHYLLIDMDAPQAAKAVCYWRLDPELKCDWPYRRASAELSQLFLESVRIHLRADVPVGVALSGGIDSSAILAAMRRLVGSDHVIHAFCYVADDPDINEEHWIDVAGRSANAVVHKIAIRPDQFWRDLEHLIKVQEQPFGSASIYAQYRVMRAAHENGMKVMLSGQGSDEMFGGYRSFLVHRVRSLLQQNRNREARQLARRASRLPGSKDLHLLELVATTVPPTSEGKTERSRSLHRPWFNTPWFRDRGVVMKPQLEVFSGHVFRDRLHDTFVRSSLPHLLRYEDRNSMTSSIESRLPFLTPALVEFAFSLPDEYLIDSHGRSKAILRESLRGILPSRIRRRRDKIGFQTPDRAWVVGQNTAVKAMFRGDTARQIPVIDFEAADREWTSMVNGSVQFGGHLWRWVNLERWVKQFNVQFP